jgi:subtilisin family serine protease
MRKSLPVIGVALLVSLALTAPAGASPDVEVTKATGEKITGQYIVTLTADASINATAASVAAERLHTYRAALRGFAAKLNSAQLDRLRRDPNVVRIEEDGVAHTEATQYNPPWGLDRIDQTNLPLSTTYTYNTTAPAVSAYIIDTGIAATHPQFGGRAANVYDALGGNGADCNGHGTHVAGTVGSASYGVAKSVRLRGVRVLNCSGSGSWSGVIAGLDWVTANHVKPAVANLSIGGGYNATVNSATARMISAGVFTAVAAGGSNADACNYSPASVPGAITTMASDRADTPGDVQQLGPVHRPVRARCVDPVDLVERRHQHPQRHLHGSRPCDRSGRAVQGNVRGRGQFHGACLDRQQRDRRGDQGKPTQHSEPAAQQAGTVTDT